jgi:hypothetical protein
MRGPAYRGYGICAVDQVTLGVGGSPVVIPGLLDEFGNAVKGEVPALFLPFGTAGGSVEDLLQTPFIDGADFIAVV